MVRAMTRESVGAAGGPVERLASAPRAGWPSGLTGGVATRSRSGRESQRLGNRRRSAHADVAGPGRGLAIIRPAVMVMMIAVVIMVVVMMVVAMMNMAWLIVCMHVDEGARKCAHGRCQGHTQGRRHGKHRRHRPNEGDAASACSLQSRQHLFSLGSSPELTITPRPLYGAPPDTPSGRGKVPQFR